MEYNTIDMDINWTIYIYIYIYNLSSHTDEFW